MPGTEKLPVVPRFIGTFERLQSAHRKPLKAIIQGVGIFTPAEVDCAMEVIGYALTSGSGYTAYAAVQGDYILGYICYGATPITDRVFDMYWLVVDQVCQGQGIGRRLMEFMESELRLEARMIMIETSSRPPYERARRLYKSMGYQLAAQIPDFYACGDDKLIFCKRIT